jgi:hypothetical protein
VRYNLALYAAVMQDRILLVKAQAQWKRGDIEALDEKEIKKIPRVEG